MTFTSFSPRILSRAAVAGVALITAAGLAACGDDSSKPVGGTPDINDYFSASGALADMRPTIEGLGYTCNPLPVEAFDDAVSLSCLPADTGAGLPILTLFNKTDVATGADAAEAELTKMLSYATEAAAPEAAAPGGVDYSSREVMGQSYLALDGDEITGVCNTSSKNCDDTAGKLGLKVSLLDGVLTEEELQAKQQEQTERDQEEYLAKQEEEEAARQRELQTYSGWGSLDDAVEQLRAWDISCTEESMRDGHVAWCKLHSVMVVYDMSLDKLEDEGVFDKVGRDDMVSVSDGDWQVLCTPGSREPCDLIAEKTGKQVKDGA